MSQENRKIAYFSMEFALNPEIPNFAGGLGVLAADMMKSCADMEVPVVGVSLIYHWDDDPAKAFDFSKYFKKCPEVVKVKIENREVVISAWEYIIKSPDGFEVPIYFLSSYLPENERWDRDLTKELYTTQQYTRLCQEAILGIGGVRILRALGYNDINYFHMNEGHAAFLIFERLKETKFDDEKVRASCRFTTHTPIAAGHDRFPYNLSKQVFTDMLPWHIKKLASSAELHTTRLALSMSGKSNAVSRRHREVCEKMFPEYKFIGITNGVHHNSWVTGGMKDLFDKNLPGWREDPYVLAKAAALPDDELKKAHLKNKKALVDFINSDDKYFPYHKDTLREDDYFDEKTLTVTFSRRFVPYKRPLLLFHDLDRLREIGYKKLQIIYAGHCNPNDEFCNNIMAELKHLEKELRGQIRLAVMPDRNLDTTAILASGSDVWLNNPEPPLEASGTSGMKAAMNGGVNLSVADGWWAEACEQNPRAGFTFGTDISGHDEIDAEELYSALQNIIDCYYKSPADWTDRMKQAISLGSYFNTHRCVTEYINQLWTE
jgi:starch phosphorylase